MRKQPRKTTTKPPPAIETNGGAESISSHHTTPMCGYISKEQIGLKGKGAADLCLRER
jgi:hypothetical protein